MDVHFHAHHADVSDLMRARAEREVRRAALRMPRVVEAIVHFEEDGGLHRVTITLRAPHHHDIVAHAEHRFYGPALGLALSRVRKQAGRERQSLPKGRAREVARERARA